MINCVWVTSFIVLSIFFWKSPEIGFELHKVKTKKSNHHQHEGIHETIRFTKKNMQTCIKENPWHKMQFCSFIHNQIDNSGIILLTAYIDTIPSFTRMHCVNDSSFLWFFLQTTYRTDDFNFIFLKYHNRMKIYI